MNVEISDECKDSKKNLEKYPDAPHGAITYYHFSDFNQALGLDDDIEITGIKADHITKTICILFEHPDLPMFHKAAIPDIMYKGKRTEGKWVID